MNERIKQLAEQAFGSTIDTDPILVYEAEKFAELIVQECVKSVAETPFGYKDYRSQIEEDMRNACAASINQHFGVEDDWMQQAQYRAENGEW